MISVDLTDTTIAETTWLLANIEYYRAMLERLQNEAVRCDYYFTRGDQPPPFPQRLPDALCAILQRAILRARIRFLEPLTSDELLERRLDGEHSSADGYGLMWMHSIMAALRAQGIWLVPGPDATAQLAAICRESEEAREGREKARAEESRDIDDLFDSVRLEVESNSEPRPD
jgi:hypothetical protein